MEFLASDVVRAHIAIIGTPTLENFLYFSTGCIVMNYKALYEKVMKIDPKIRFATICNMNGKIMHSGHRKGVKNLLTPQESRRSLQQAVNIWKLRNQLAPKIGKGKYVLAEYGRIKRITARLGNKYMLYVTTDVRANHTRIIGRILKLTARVR